MKNVVVIPVYKEELKVSELKSFRQCLRVFCEHDIVIVTNRNVNLLVYNDISFEENKIFDVVLFDEFYFNSIKGYNRLMLSREFYLRFESYDYMLLYQLDAYVFRNELDYWCDLGYDYIGAPWFYSKDDIYYTYKFVGVGNGGLSLRKISYCLKVLDFPKYIPFLTPIGLLIGCNSLKNVFKFPFKLLGIRNNMHFYCCSGVVNEDAVFSVIANHSWIIANLPDYMMAMKFSFEVHPSYLFQLNEKKLPFGCHAFEKNEFEIFWNKYIR